MKIIDIVKGYIGRGWMPVPIPFKGKGPIIPGWQKFTVTSENIGEHFNGKDQNVGIILGQVSGGLSDVDLDCREAVALAPRMLPKTGAVFGRHSKPKSHYLYTVYEPEPKAAIRLEDEEGSTIIELRLGGKAGAQTVFPGSVHPSGEKIEWVSSGDTAKISCAELRAAIVRIAIGSLMMRHWPGKGWHEASLRVGGFLARAGWDVDVIGDFVETILEQIGKDDGSLCRRAAVDAADLHVREGRGYGLPALAEFFGEKASLRMAKLLDYKDTSNEDTLDQLNKKYCILPVAGKMRVLEFVKVLDRMGATFYSAADFRIMLDNIRLKAKNKKGEETSIGQGSWWLNHKNRRQYAGLLFKPGDPAVIDGHLNLWRGWGIEPKKGKWTLLKNHIAEVLADGDKKSEEYILKWTTWMFQNPGSPAEVVVVFRGGRGAGKGLFAREIRKAFGQHGVHISSAGHLAGRFNAHLMDCAFLFADEAFWPGDKASEGTLKRMITEDMLFVEKKGVDGFEVDNNLHIIMASNVDWVVPAGIDERRFAVFDTSEEKKQSAKYFNPLYAELAAGGMAAMMHDMLATNLKGWHPRDSIPKNAALRDQQSQSLNPYDQWWVDLLHAGGLPGANEDNPMMAASEYLFKRAVETVPGLRFASYHLLGRYLRKMGCTRNHNWRVNGQRAWLFPPLLEARKRWDRGIKTDWDNPELTEWRLPRM